ncbi:hypothetical protein F8M49_21135 [Rhodococcus zopfii]|uniref:Uncharacterized protein n=1 Tax=Rhodococcus zopfii TaxID=43772 RepID=A0ABU3WMA5_9NOCA|nr:hypothetical protein [Rhodococcus zopfii]MDV2477226.1 hypothetical protein [Rhodococcus zopfii]
MNDRLHWREKAKRTQHIRVTVFALARQARVWIGCAHVTVGLHYRPRDNRRRDADNLMPVLKAACDGLVDYGLTADDTPEQMQKLMPIIHPAEKGRPGSLWLTIGDPQ